MLSGPVRFLRHLAVVAVVVLASSSLACRDGSDSVIEPKPEPVTPVTLPCAAAAPLHGTPDWSNPHFRGFVVAYHGGIDPAAETARLSLRYGFAPRVVFRYALRGFAAELTPEALNGLRCEASVQWVEVDYWVKVIPA